MKVIIGIIAALVIVVGSLVALVMRKKPKVPTCQSENFDCSDCGNYKNCYGGR